MGRDELAKQNSSLWFKGNVFDDCINDEEFQTIVTKFLCGEILAEDTLTNKQKALVILVALVTNQTVASIGKYTLAALNIGVSPEEIKEAMYQCTPYIGIEKVRCSLTEINKIFEQKGVKQTSKKNGVVSEENRLEKGLEIQQNIFGKDVINSMRDNAPIELKEFQNYLSSYCFGDFYTRNILDLKMRELIVFCAICSLGDCKSQAKSHALANINVGNSREILISALVQCLPFNGFPRTLNAIACVDEVTK